MAFLVGLGEMLVEGLAGGIMSNIGNEVVKTFKPIVAKKVGDEIVSYSASHPKGFIAQSLDSATASRYNNLNQAKKLIQFEPNCNFWFNIKKKPIKSLEWLLSFEGKKYLLKEKSLLNIDKDIKISYHLESNKIGNDKTINKKVKTLKEFLNGKT